ncbi:MAG: hypothetical protein Q7V05_07545 [Methanoregula sp.]|nr:hypothetical protein [Methanoregula sp.]
MTSQSSAIAAVLLLLKNLNQNCPSVADAIVPLPMLKCYFVTGAGQNTGPQNRKITARAVGIQFTMNGQSSATGAVLPYGKSPD